MDRPRNGKTASRHPGNAPVPCANILSEWHADAKTNLPPGQGERVFHNGGIVGGLPSAMPPG